MTFASIFPTMKAFLYFRFYRLNIMVSKTVDGINKQIDLLEKVSL